MGEALDKVLLALAGSVQVEGHTRTSKSGKVVRVSSYTRSPGKMSPRELLGELTSLGSPSQPQQRARKVLIEREIQARKRTGRWVEPKSYPKISRSSLSNPDTPRTRKVSAEEFDRLAEEGEKRLGKFRTESRPAAALTDAKKWAGVKKKAWEATRSEWGGATIDSHTGEALPEGIDKYALTVKGPGLSSESVPIDADQATFDAALERAKKRFGKELESQQHYLGIFRDEDSNRIDFDPVLVVDTLEDVETIGSFTNAVGGAFHFASFDGFWPPYVEG